jgi:hypothetical protein
VRVGKLRRGKKARKGVERKVREVVEGESVVEEMGLVEGGSESETGDESDVFYDFSREEAEGWVPVMVAEDEEGDDWMSLTGSWVLMRGAAESKGDGAGVCL